MKKPPELIYLKHIATVFLILFAFFMLGNLVQAIPYVVIYSGKSFEYSHECMLVMKYVWKVYFWLNVFTYILHLVFLLIANRFVKKRLRKKGTHFLIVLLAFLPIANYFLRFMLWRKFNRQVFNYSGIEYVGSNRKIIIIWVLTLISDSLSFLLPFIMPIFYRHMSISEIASFSMLRLFIITICQLLVSIVYFTYYLEFKQVLGKVDPQYLDSSLIDD